MAKAVPSLTLVHQPAAVPSGSPRSPPQSDTPDQASLGGWNHSETTDARTSNDSWQTATDLLSGITRLNGPAPN